MFVNLSKKSRVNRVRKLITKRHLKYCPQRTQFKVLMNTNQGGYFQFSICPLQSSSEASTQACFDQHPVPLADGSGFRYGKDSSDDYLRTHFYYKISFQSYVYIVHKCLLCAMTLLIVGLIASISVITQPGFVNLQVILFSILHLNLMLNLVHLICFLQQYNYLWYSNTNIFNVNTSYK